jgi:hypothetical protein
MKVTVRARKRLLMHKSRPQLGAAFLEPIFIDWIAIEAYEPLRAYSLSLAAFT